MTNLDIIIVSYLLSPINIYRGLFRDFLDTGSILECMRHIFLGHIQILCLSTGMWLGLVLREFLLRGLVFPVVPVGLAVVVLAAVLGGPFRYLSFVKVVARVLPRGHRHNSRSVCSQNRTSEIPSP